LNDIKQKHEEEKSNLLSQLQKAVVNQMKG